MQMAKLTAAQKRELKRLHQSRTGIVVQHYGIQLMQVYGGLQAKGLVDNQMYHDQTRFTLTESGLTLAASLFGSSEPTPPVAAIAEPAKPKTTLTWEQVGELLTEDPDRIDIFLPYANSARVVTSINRQNGYWDVIAGGWRMSFDGNSIAYTITAPVTPASSTPETVAGESVASAPESDNRKAILHAELKGGQWLAKANEQKEAGRNDEVALRKATYWLNRLNILEGFTDDTSYAKPGKAPAPVADSDIPFAAGMDDSEPVTMLTDDLLAASRQQWSERGASIWTHDAADSIRNMLASEDPIRVNYVLRISGAASAANGITGHGRKARKTANSRVSSKPMAKVTQQANMQRVKAFKPFSVENKAMPIAPLTIVPKVTKAALTRWLETRNRRAA
jgi:hypothetical protein